MRNRASIFSNPSSPNSTQSCQYHHPTISSPASPCPSPSQFNYDYCQYTRDLPIFEQVKDSLRYLYELFQAICAAGGFVAVVAGDFLGAVVRGLRGRFVEMGNFTIENVLEHYVKYQLFSYEIVLKTGKRITNDKLMCFQLPKFVSGTQLTESLTNLEKGLALCNQDIVVLSSLCSALKIDQSLFNLINVFEKNGNDVLKVFFQDINQRDRPDKKPEIKNICQNLDTCSLNLGIPAICKSVTEGNPIRNNLNEYQLTLQQFNAYLNPSPSRFDQKNQPTKPKFPRNISENEKNKIIFGYEFDPKDYYLVEQINKKIKETFLCYKERYDLLSYSDEDIIGVTFPQFEIQGEGNWQGGSQQAYGMARVNINFGPDSTEWFCISGENLNKFYAVIKSQYGISAERIEGEWFEEIDWFIDRKIPIKKIIQKKGDGVIIGPGSMSWQKSKGKSLHANWNLMIKSERQIVAAVSKCTKIKQLQSENPSQPLVPSRWHKKIPLKTIFLRFLNHEQISASNPIKNEGQPSSNCFMVVREWLKRWYLEEQKHLNQLTVRRDIPNSRYKYYYLFDGESYCSFCGNQVLNYYLNNNGLSCLECASRYFTGKRVPEIKDKNIFFKYQPFWVSQLIYYGSNRLLQKNQPYFQLQDLCKGEYVGNVTKCCVAAYKQKLNEPSTILAQDQFDWEETLRVFTEQKENTVEYQYQKKVESLLHKAKNPNQTQEVSLPKNFMIQTNLSLICEKSDKDIEDFISSPLENINQVLFPQTSEQSQASCLSQQSIRRKAKRMLMRNQIQQRSENSSSREYRKHEGKKRDKSRNYNARKDYPGRHRKFERNTEDYDETTMSSRKNQRLSFSRQKQQRLGYQADQKFSHKRRHHESSNSTQTDIGYDERHHLDRSYRKKY